MNKLISLIGSISALFLTVTAFGQTGQEQEKPKSEAPAEAKHGSSSVVIRQSGSGNRAVVRQSANGTTTEVVQAQGNSNTVEVRHDGNSTVIIEQKEEPRKETPGSDPTKKKQ